MSSLYKKIHMVMVESEAIEKKMTVGEGKNSYKAVSEAAVLNAIKPLLKKHGLVMFPVGVVSILVLLDYGFLRMNP